MDVKQLAPGTVLTSKADSNKWQITCVTPAMEGATCYRLDLVGSRSVHVRIAYSYEIGADRPLQVEVAAEHRCQQCNKFVVFVGGHWTHPITPNNLHAALPRMLS